MAAPAASGVAAPAASEAAAPAAGHSPRVSILQDLINTCRLGCCRSTAWHAKPQQDVALVKNPVESRRGCTPQGESRGGRIPYKRKRSVPWLPDPVQTKYVSPTVAGCRTKIPLWSHGSLIQRGLVGPEVKTGPGEGPGIFKAALKFCSHISLGAEKMISTATQTTPGT